LRGFYEYFDGKDELLLALFEETVREAYDDICAAVDAEGEPVPRLRAFAVRLHEWCDPGVRPRKRGRHNRRPIADFSIHLAVSHADRVQAALAPQSRLLHELIDDAQAAGMIQVTDTKRATALVQQMVMHSSFGNRLVEQPRQQLTAEETWEF